MNKFDRQVRKDLKQEKRQEAGFARKLIWAVLGFFVWIALFYFAYLGLSDTIRKSSELVELPEPELSYTLSTPRYDEDIFENLRYLDQDRQIRYGTLSSQTVLDSPESAPDAYGRLFFNYFQAIIHGDAESYRGFFTEAFIASSKLPEDFTMQMLYDVKVQEVSDFSGADEAGVTVVGKEFLVSYRILDNNGTFKDSLPPRASQTEHYKVIETQSGELKIDAIILEKDAANTAPRGLDPVKTIIFGTILLICVITLIIAAIKIISIIKKRKQG